MSGIHVIFVDDDDLMLRMVEPLLPELDTEPKVGSVALAQDPTSAISLLDAAPPGPLVVISDFNLKAPQNGVDVLREARARRPTSVRILLSGYAAVQIGDVTGGGAIHAFIEKPLRIRDLLAPLADTVRNELRAPG